MPSTSAKHRKPTRTPASQRRGEATSRHRRNRRLLTPVRLATVAGTAFALGVGAAAAANALPTNPSPATASRLDGLSIRAQGAGPQGATAHANDLRLAQAVAEAGLNVPSVPKSKDADKRAKQKIRRPKPKQPAPPVYLNPLRAIAGLIPERVDMGADFGGSGPIYAIGNAVITNAMTTANWPGGGWVTYQLTSGPAAGLQVFVAEDVTPTVQVGEHVTSSTVVANMYAGSAGIETGWALPDGSSAESQLAVAGGISGGGPFPTAIGLNFDALLQVLGVPAAPNFAGSGYGVVPSNYPTDWAGALGHK